jgi:hypothetical protein
MRVTCTIGGVGSPQKLTDAAIDEDIVERYYQTRAIHRIAAQSGRTATIGRSP